MLFLHREKLAWPLSFCLPGGQGEPGGEVPQPGEATGRKPGQARSPGSPWRLAVVAEDVLRPCGLRNPRSRAGGPPGDSRSKPGARGDGGRKARQKSRKGRRPAQEPRFIQIMKMDFSLLLHSRSNMAASRLVYLDGDMKMLRACFHLRKRTLVLMETGSCQRPTPAGARPRSEGRR